MPPGIDAAVQWLEVAALCVALPPTNGARLARLLLVTLYHWQLGDPLHMLTGHSEVLSWKPRALIYRGLISKEECAYIRNKVRLSPRPEDPGALETAGNGRAERPSRAAARRPSPSCSAPR